MWKQITIVLIVILFVLLAYAIYIFVDGANPFTQKEIIVAPQKTTLENKDVPIIENNNKKDEQLHPDTPDKKSSYHITVGDCGNTCGNFDENTASWRYCANLCGIVPIKKDVTNCTDKSGLSKDYCFRDKAISAKDLSSCEEITDQGIFAQCKDNVAEQIIDAL